MGITEVVLTGLSAIDFDTFEVTDFSLNDAHLGFTLDAKIVVLALDILYKGVIKSSDMCFGGPVEYLAVSSFGEVSLNLGVTIVGKLADDRSHFIISDATFSELGLEGLDSSTTTLSDIAPYSYDDRNQLLQSFSVVSDSVFGAID